MSFAQHVSAYLRRAGFRPVPTEDRRYTGLRVRNDGPGRAWIRSTLHEDTAADEARVRVFLERVADALREGGYLASLGGGHLSVTRPATLDRAAHDAHDGDGCLTAPDSGLPLTAEECSLRRVHCRCGRRWELREGWWRQMRLREIPVRGDRLELRKNPAEVHGWHIPDDVEFQVQRVIDNRMVSGKEESVQVEIWPADQELPRPGAEAGAVWIEDVVRWWKPKK